MGFGPHWMVSEMRGHMLKVELNSLDPKIFDNIQDFFTKFKSIFLNLKACGVDKSKQEKHLLLSILEKLGSKYVVFVSTFHLGRYTSRSTWTMPTLAEFIESITHEQAKLIQMGLINDSKARALVVHESSSKSYPKVKQKGNGKAHSEQGEDGKFL
jgi:hypothetical protein